MTLIMWKPEEPSREWDCFLWILFLQKRKPEPEFPADSWELEGELQALSGAELEGYEIHMGETVLKGEAGHSVSIEDQVSGECKEDGAYCKNVCGTYVHGVLTGRCGRGCCTCPG